MPAALKSTPDFDVIEGVYWPDRWTTPAVALELHPVARARTVRITVTNPHFNGAYLRNKVRLLLDGEAAFADLMFPGHGVRVEREVPARSSLLVELASEATLAPDPLDDRSRGVWLSLSQKAVEKKATSSAGGRS
jgi:hypothetical protein